MGAQGNVSGDVFPTSSAHEVRIAVAIHVRNSHALDMCRALPYIHVWLHLKSRWNNCACTLDMRSEHAHLLPHAARTLEVTADPIDIIQYVLVWSVGCLHQMFGAAHYATNNHTYPQ